MRRGKKDPVREDRINNEVIMDANGREEQVGEIVQVQEMAPEDACSSEMLVLIRWQGRTMGVPLAQLSGVRVDESTAEAIGDWHYWVAQGYCF
jgi:hypothetical protein